VDAKSGAPQRTSLIALLKRNETLPISPAVVVCTGTRGATVCGHKGRLSRPPTHACSYRKGEPRRRLAGCWGEAYPTTCLGRRGLAQLAHCGGARARSQTAHRLVSDLASGHTTYVIAMAVRAALALIGFAAAIRRPTDRSPCEPTANTRPTVGWTRALAPPPPARSALLSADPAPTRPRGHPTPTRPRSALPAGSASARGPGRRAGRTPRRVLALDARLQLRVIVDRHPRVAVAN